MKINTSYSAKIKHYNHIFQETAAAYRDAVDFMVSVLMEHQGIVTGIGTQTEQVNAVERLTVVSPARPLVPHDFAAADKRFYKFPCYLRRAAIAEAIGKVSSYLSNFANWEAEDPQTRGRMPGYPKAGFCYPVLYKGNMYRQLNQYLFNVKVYRNNTWDWLTVKLRKSDVDYIQRHCRDRKPLSPTLQKRGKCWYLDFAFEEEAELSNTPIGYQTALCVDLGINNACTCSVMLADGTVVGRHFLKLPAEYDSLQHALERIKRAQRSGAKRMPRLWARAKGINDSIAVKTAAFLMEFAIQYNVDVIVFEHLDTGGKKKGSKKQRLHHWRAQYVLSMVADKAHRLGMHISHVCAWNTSRLAFDGSGRVKRGKESERTAGNYSLCEFTTGKLYHCDLNASYNIGARYFVREVLKSLDPQDRLRLEAKVPSACKRSTCTLSTLISLCAELHVLPCGVANA